MFAAASVEISGSCVATAAKVPTTGKKRIYGGRSREFNAAAEAEAVVDDARKSSGNFGWQIKFSGLAVCATVAASATGQARKEKVYVGLPRGSIGPFGFAPSRCPV